MLEKALGILLEAYKTTSWTGPVRLFNLQDVEHLLWKNGLTETREERFELARAVVAAGVLRGRLRSGALGTRWVVAPASVIEVFTEAGMEEPILFCLDPETLKPWP